MPFLAGLLGAAFTSLLTFFAQWIGKKSAMGIALGAMLVGGWVALQVCEFTLWLSVSFSLSTWAHAWVLRGLGFVAGLLPLGFNQMLQAILLGKFCRWLLDRHREWAKAFAAAS